MKDQEKHLEKMGILPDTPLDELINTFSLRINENIKKLIEFKHLYQSVQIEYQDIIDSLPATVAFHQNIQIEFTKLVNGEWEPSDPANQRLFSYNDSSNTLRKIHFKVPDVKLFCDSCGRIEAYNLISAEDFLQHRHFNVILNLIDNKVLQVFVISFQCQSCKSIPEVFLVRRVGMKLTISGRSPIEHVEVPSVIPKTVKQFYSGAIVAHQSGQTLAGIFLLRTMIEQWTRQQINKPALKADDIIDEYMCTLPDDFRQRFPSIRDLYSKLSEDIHSATGSTTLFDEANKEIIEHFDARRLFKLNH